MDIHQLTHIFCQIDDFCKEFKHYTEAKLLAAPSDPKHRGPACSLNDSEIMTILVAFQSSGYRNFKAFLYRAFISIFQYRISHLTQLQSLH